MSWKNIKDHYQIGHHVQIIDGTIWIGSSYCPKLIRISAEGKVAWGELGPGSNDDLQRYYADMTSSPAKLKELLNAPDTFTRSLPVYTYDGAQILEKQCEEWGWPNITHDGQIQYENQFSADKATVVQWAKENAKAGIEIAQRNIADTEQRLAEHRSFLTAEQATLAQLEATFPN